MGGTRRPGTRLAPWAVPAAYFGAAAQAQQVLEVDFDVGRTIIDDEWSAMYPRTAAVNWSGNVLCVQDDEEPEGIMAFLARNGRLDPHDFDADEGTALRS